MMTKRKRSQQKEFLEPFGQDYREKKARLKVLKNEMKYYITDKNKKEHDELVEYIEVIDYIFDNIPYPGGSILRRNVLEDEPLKTLTDEFGYSYNFMCERRAEARRILMYCLTGERQTELPKLSILVEEAIGKK